MKTKLETLFEKGRYDTRKSNNRSFHIIDKSILDKIENEGVSSEILEELKTTIFYYKTQITIHGIFPALGNNYIGGYKNLFQNQNLSIGVKFNAVDYIKKNKIYSYACSIKNFSIKLNSTDFYIYKTVWIYDKNEIAEAGKKMKEEFSLINKDLFFGNISVTVYSIWGAYIIEGIISISAIYEKNVNACIENLCGMSISECDRIISEQEQERQLKREKAEQEFQERQREKAEQEKPLREEADKFLRSLGAERIEKKIIEPGDVAFIYSLNLEEKTITYKTILFSKKKLLRKNIFAGILTNPDLKKDVPESTNIFKPKVGSGYFYKQPEIKNININTNSNIQIID